MKKALKYLITAAVGLAIATIVIFTKDIFGQTNAHDVMHILCDAFFVSGVCLSCAGLIVFASNGGAFDMLVYGVQILFYMFADIFSGGTIKRKHKDFYEYKKSKEGRKHSMSFILIVGLIFIAISLIFLGAYYYTV